MYLCGKFPQNRAVYMLRGSCTPGLLWSLETPWGPRPKMALPKVNPPVQETSLTTLFLSLSLSLFLFWLGRWWWGLPLEYWPSYKGLSSQWPAPSSSALLPACLPAFLPSSDSAASCKQNSPLPASPCTQEKHSWHRLDCDSRCFISWNIAVLFPITPGEPLNSWYNSLSAKKRNGGEGGVVRRGEARVLAPRGEGKESHGVFLLFFCLHFQLSSLFGRSPCTTCVQQVSYTLIFFHCRPNDTLAAAWSARGCS